MKLSILVVVAALTFMLGYLAYYGRQARRTRDLTVIARHHAATNCVMWLALIAIVLIEVLVQQFPSIRTALFWVHLSFAVTFAGLFLAMRFRFDGMHSRVHRHLAYGCLSAYAATLITGGVILWRI